VVGFSATALGQTTLSFVPSNQTLNLTVPPGGTGTAQLIVNTTSAPTLSINTNSLPSWLTVTPCCIVNDLGSVTLTVRASLARTSFGTGYTAFSTFTVGFEGQQVSPALITVNLTVGVPSVLSANPSSLNFTAVQGQSVGSPTSVPGVQILSSTQALQYTLSTSTTDGNAWLIVSPGCTTQSPCTTDPNGSGFTVSVNPSVLAASTTSYQGTITAQSTTTSDSATISVTLTVSLAPSLTVTPAVLPQFLYQVGSSAAQPTQQTLDVTATSGSVQFGVTVSPAVSWLVLNTNTGFATSTPVPITLNINKASIPTTPGTYYTNITVAAIPASGTAVQPILVTLVVSNNPLLSASNNSLMFTAPFAGQPPATQQVTLTSTGGAVGFTVALDSNNPWLTVSPLSGSASSTSPVTLTFTANPSSPNVLPVSTYNATIKVTPSNGDQYTVPIGAELQVTTASQLAAGPAILHFSYETTQLAPSAQGVQITSSGQPVGFSVTVPALTATSNCPANWLNAASNSTTTPATVTVSVITAGMTAGTCNGNVVVTPSSGTGGTALTIPVTVDISGTAELNVSIPLGFGVQSVQQGASTSNFFVSLTSTDPLNQVQFTATPSSSQNWLFVTSGGSTPQQLQVIVSPGLLTTGRYNGSITISSASLPSGSVTIPYTLTVNPPVSVTVTPSGSLAFTQPQGGPVPLAQVLTLTSSGGSANFIATVTQGTSGPWLQINSANTASGTINPSGTISVSINPTVANALAASATPYTSQINLAFPNSSTPTVTINVNLTVTQQTILVAPQTLTFSYQLGATSTPASQPVSVISTPSGVTFSVAVTSSGGWLTTDTVNSTTPKTVNVSINPQNIPAGTAVGSSLTGTIDISAPTVQSAPIAVTVTLNILAPPKPQPATIANSGSAQYGAISPGELITIQGTLLGPPTPASGTSFTVNSQGTVNSTLNGVQVLFDLTPGTPTYVSANVINVIVPWEVNGRTSTNITVVYNGSQSAPIPQSVVSLTPSIYTLNGNGLGQAAAYNVSDGKINGPVGSVTTIGGQTIPTEPAAQGSYIAVFGTGGGITVPPSLTGSVNPLAALPLNVPLSSVTATLGGVSAKVTYAGAAPGDVTGVNQYDIQIPTEVAGPALPIVITVNGVSTFTSGSSGPTVSVAAQ
jgi:uncharacterized protein (TIGR03437 family)